MWFFVWWALGILVAALVIAIDMRRLGASRVGLSIPVWVAVCVVVGPGAWVPYLVARRTVRRRLIEATWAFIGDTSHPASTRLARLRALMRGGVIGPVIFTSCLRALRNELAVNSNSEESK